MYRIPDTLLENSGWHPPNPEECCENGRIEVDGKIFFFHQEIPHMETHRWNDTSWFIFSDDSDAFWAVAYDYGATEEQESGYIYNEPVFFRVTPVKKVETFWQKVNNV